MKLKSGLFYSMLMGIAVLVISSCSTQKNTGKSRFWHSFTAKYNTYYNGTLAYIDGSLAKEEGNKDNYTEILPLYYVGNKQSVAIGSGDFDRAIEKCEKAIKLHSIKKRPEWNKSRRKTERDIEWLNRKEYNPMLWKAWLLMGRSQFHKGEFDAAAATFSYMSRLYATQPAIYSKARAWLAKSYVAADWMYDAEDVIRNMERDSILWSAKKEWNYTYAYYFIQTGEYEKAIPYLREVIKKEGRKKQKAREWYLLGQLYAALGQKDEAYKAYKKIPRLNPPYELEFNARIAMTEVMAGQQAKKMISKLKSMARNDNNKNYLDQVYYAIGNIYMSQKDTLNAISAYEKGNEKSIRNGIEKGVLLLRLGDVYWDKEKYGDAGRCYGEAIGLLDKERKDYKQLSERSQKLDLLVPFTDAIHLQDSLQSLALMSEKDRNEAIDRVIEALKKREKEEKDANAEQFAQQTVNRNSQNTTGRNNNAPQPPTAQQRGGPWYFYNQMAVNQGKQAFQKQWGKRDNIDHWRRSNQTVVNMGDDEEMPDSLSLAQSDSIQTDIAGAETDAAVADSLANDPHNREYYLAQIPFTEEQKAESDAIIMDALYNSGVIFKDKLDKLELSEKQFQRLLTQYPAYEGMENAYYHLFLLYSRLGQHQVAQTYIDKLKTDFPESQWTILLTDPYFADNQKFGVHIEDSLYAATYQAFKEDRFKEIKANVQLSGERFPLGANRDKFVFIGGLSKLNAGDVEGCLEDMNVVVTEHSQSKLAEMAGMILNGVKEGRKLRGGRFDIGDVWNRRQVALSENDSLKSKEFTDNPDIEFVFMIAYQPDSVDANRLLYALAKYNFTGYMVRNFDIETEDQDGLNVMRVTGFNNYHEAAEYAREFRKQANITEILGKSRTYIISRENMELLGVKFSYADYEKFYAEHFDSIQPDDNQRLQETEDAGTSLDDGGSVPGNLTPIIKKQEEPQPQEQTEETVPQDDGTIIIEDEQQQQTPTEEDGTIIIDDEPVDQPAEEEEVIIIEEESQPAEDGDIIIIDEENQDSPAEDDEDVIIIDETEEENNGEDDTVIILEDDEEEGTEDETLEIDGF